MVTTVFAESLERWIMLDAAFHCYCTRTNGDILGLQEARATIAAGDRVLAGGDIGLNPGPGLAWWNGFDLRSFYPRYMSKNLFRMEATVLSEFNYESAPKDRIYCSLQPAGYAALRPEVTPRADGLRNVRLVLSDPTAFWAPPAAPRGPPPSLGTAELGPAGRATHRSRRAGCQGPRRGGAHSGPLVRRRPNRHQPAANPPAPSANSRPTPGAAGIRRWPPDGFAPGEGQAAIERPDARTADRAGAAGQIPDHEAGPVDLEAIRWRIPVAPQPRDLRAPTLDERVGQVEAAEGCPRPGHRRRCGGAIPWPVREGNDLPRPRGG